jgi:hypothetical protein
MNDTERDTLIYRILELDKLIDYELSCDLPIDVSQARLNQAQDQLDELDEADYVYIP